ncbi:sodium:proton exchanger [Streptomyces sp. WM4235]|uniref:cation:proton antiporter n=1 Tax=Streptomyces sp. WM4235 TaxID=1415551 RepID=UPI0006C39495|nr:cation:proton antiporter [Streptomyces sp. WM4235]KOU52237.1 sodium:proton exchanger [Streptomyces sp. WM4235]
MSLKMADVGHVLLALCLLLTAARAGGHLFKRLRQPTVVGEIAGGLVLGPTLLGLLLPDFQAWLLPREGGAASALGIFYHLGLLLLVYQTGVGMRRHTTGVARRTISAITVAGLVIPFALGLLLARQIGMDGLAGRAGTPDSLALVFGMAVAVTSVPVIARIMFDLDIMGTRFSKIVLTVAVIEDVVLYVVLAIVLGLSQQRGGEGYGLLAASGITSVPWTVAYFAVVPTLFLGIFLWRGPALVRWLSRTAPGAAPRSSVLADRLVLLFLLCASCIGLGIDPIFGALVAGLCSPEVTVDEKTKASTELHSLSMNFLVPVYFAIVGLRLDLVRQFDVLFFCWFAVFAFAAKFASVWIGARLAGEGPRSAVNLAVAMNARGGPGIVLASVTYEAGVINESFFVTLVVLSILTSQVSGVWLSRAVSHGWIEPLPVLASAPEPAAPARRARLGTGGLKGGNPR